MYGRKTKHGYRDYIEYLEGEELKRCQYCKHLGSMGIFYACYKDNWVRMALMGPDIVAFNGLCEHFNWAKKYKPSMPTGIKWVDGKIVEQKIIGDKTRHGYMEKEYVPKNDGEYEVCGCCRYFGSCNGFTSCYKASWLYLWMNGPDGVVWNGWCRKFNQADWRKRQIERKNR